MADPEKGSAIAICGPPPGHGIILVFGAQVVAQ